MSSPAPAPPSPHPQVPHNTSIDLDVPPVAADHISAPVHFSFHSNGWPNAGFAIWSGGQWRAFLNRCSHLPLSLDLGDGDLLGEDGKTFICHNHGATFCALSGHWLSGPGRGGKLEVLAVELLPSGRLRVDLSQVDADRPIHPDYLPDDWDE